MASHCQCGWYSCQGVVIVTPLPPRGHPPGHISCPLIHLNILPLKSHIYCLVEPGHLLVPVQQSCWCVHAAVQLPFQGVIPLLKDIHLVLPMSVHEVFPYHVQCVIPSRSSLHQTSHWIQYSVKLHHIGLPPSSPGFHLPGMGQAPPVGSLRMVPKWVFQHRCTTLATTYPCLLPLPTFFSLTCHPLLVYVLVQLPPYESGGWDHCLGLPQVFVQSNPLRHMCGCSHLILHPHGVSPCNAAIFGIKHDDVLPCHLYQPMLGILGGAQTSIKMVHTTVSTTMLKMLGETGSPWVAPCFFLNCWPYYPPAYGSTTWSFHYLSRICWKFAPRPYPGRTSVGHVMPSKL